jgi:hypothetical protein
MLVRGGRKIVEGRVTAEMEDANSFEPLTRATDAKAGEDMGRPWSRQQEQVPLQLSGFAGTC